MYDQRPNNTMFRLYVEPCKIEYYLNNKYQNITIIVIKKKLLKQMQGDNN